MGVITKDGDDDTFDQWLVFWELWYELDCDWQRQVLSPEMVEFMDSIGGFEEPDPRRPPIELLPELAVLIEPHRLRFQEQFHRMRGRLAKLPVGQPLILAEPKQPRPFGLQLLPEPNRKARRARRKQ